MPRKKRELSFVEQMKKIEVSGITKPIDSSKCLDLESLDSLEKRIDILFQIIKTPKRPATQMLFFIMYDIESNRTRRTVVKYLLNQGASRIQKSIFLADLSTDKFEKIKSDLAEVQAAYENFDSILIVPITTDYLQAMKVIGQNIDIDVITHSKNVMFF